MMALYKSYVRRRLWNRFDGMVDIFYLQIPLKRIVLANRDTDLELYALKLLKSQITHLGIKWRAGKTYSLSSPKRLTHIV